MNPFICSFLSPDWGSSVKYSTEIPSGGTASPRMCKAPTRDCLATPAPSCTDSSATQTLYTVVWLVFCSGTGVSLTEATVPVLLATVIASHTWLEPLPAPLSEYQGAASGIADTPMNVAVSMSVPSNESRCPVGRHIFQPPDPPLSDPSHWTS